MRIHRRPFMQGGLGLTCALAAAVGAGQEERKPGPPAPTGAPITLNIPEEPLGRALKEFAAQSHLQLVYQTGDLDSAPTEMPLQGTYIPRVALERLLADTHLHFAFLNEKTVTITATPRARTSDPVSSRLADAGLAITTDTVASELPSPSDTNFPSNSEVSATGDNTPRSQVVVTGTHIRGVSPSPTVITINSEDIKRSPYQSTGDLLRSLPQAFSGGQNVTVLYAGGSQNIQTPSASSTANLRGLGSDSTLTLVDGHRLASADFGNSVDLSLIPLAAIARVDVDTNGASAIYGADAVAGVVNVVLKKDYSGFEAWSDVGAATRGGGLLQQYGSIAGHNWDGGNAVLSYEFAKQNPVDAVQRLFVDPALGRTSIVPRTQRNSVYVAMHQDFTSTIQGFAEGLYTARSALSTIDLGMYEPGLGVNESVSVHQYGVFGGVNLRLSPSWSATITGDESELLNNDPHESIIPGLPTAYQPLSDQNHLTSAEAAADGDLFSTPAGIVKLAIGGGYRTERLTNSAPPAIPINAIRHDRYGYAEMRIPVLPSVSIRAAPSLELNLADRFDDYSDFGRANDPKVSVAFRPIDGLTVNGTWGKSFQAPFLSDEYAPRSVELENGTVPSAPTGLAPILVISGGNPSLRPQTSTNRTLGISFKSPDPHAVSASLNYFDIRYRNRIVVPEVNTNEAVVDPTVAQYVSLHPSPAAQAAALANASLINITGRPYNPNAVAALLDNRYVNASIERAKGADAVLDYRWSALASSFNIFVNGTYLDLTQRLTPLSPANTLTGTVFNPPRYRVRMGLTQQAGAWSNTIFLNYVGSSVDPFQQVPAAVSAWTTVDATAAYDFRSGPATPDFRIGVAVTNLFDRPPPYVNAAQSGLPGINFDSTNASGLGRFLTIRLRAQW